MTVQYFKLPMVTAALLLAAVANAQPSPEVSIAMPAMPLGDALRQVARTSGRSLVVDDALVAGRTAPAISGKYSPEEAVRQLLLGSGLSSKLVNGTIIVSGPMPAAVAEGGKAAGVPADGIVVTGSHVRGAPPTSPVITLSRKQIEQSGSTSVEELMRRVPQNVSAGVAQENFAVTGSGADITDHGAGINLRGLGQRATLVLVNGRRLAPSDTGSFVDVSMIPVSAIDRVEILTDGASAIYGSDAVGGVVNFILRQDYQGIEAMAQAGTTTEGGGGQLLAGLTAGTRWNGGHAMLSYQFRDAQPVKASDRSFTINLPDNWDLFPDEKTNSLYGNAHQQLAPNLTLDASGSFAARNTRRSFLDGGLPVDAAARSRAYGGDVSLGLTLGSWEIEGSASAFETRSKQQQLQLGSLFNLYNSVNSYAELALKADGDLLDLGGGAAKLALGGSLRREHFESLFATSVNAPTAQDGSRLVASAYGELNLPFFGPGNARPGLEKLDLDVAGRLEHYEAIGSSFNPKIGLLWSPVAGLALRSSYGTSFRAPLLSESFGYYNVFLFPASLLYIDPSTAPAGVGAVLAGNNPAVKPETSTSLSLGTELQPRIIPGLRLNATYYAIRFSNRIALPSPQIVVIGDPAFAPIVSINPALAHVESLFDGANQLLDFSGPGFTNGGASAADVVAIVDGRVSNSAETRTSGLDLLLSYGFALGKNRFDFDLNANRIFKFDNKLTSASPWIHALNTPFNPLRFKVRGGLSWTRGSWSAFTFVNHAAPYRDDRGAVARPVAAFTTIDAGIGFDGGLAKTGALKHVKLALEVQNLLGTRPPRLLPQPGFNQDIGYDPVNATGLGRFVSLQLRTMW